MRRFIAILVLMLLPFQFCWSAVVAYCEHEAPGTAQHQSHDAHLHQGAADLGSDEAAPESAGAEAEHSDCGHCHGGCASLLPRFPAVIASMATQHPRPAVDEAGSAQTPPRPERPQWLPLA